MRIAFVLVLAACTSDSSDCTQSIAAYCAGSACPTWDQAQDPTYWGCGSGSSAAVSLGMCGETRFAFVSRSDFARYIDTTYYYNASGQLVRVTHADGAMDDPLVCVAGAGAEPDCTHETQTQLCTQH